MKSLFQPLLARLRARALPATRPLSVDPKAVIERTLREAGLLPHTTPEPAAQVDDSVIEGEFRVVDRTTSKVPDAGNRPTTGVGTFSTGKFALGTDARAYKLFVPAGFADQRLPLIVMLHGCTQDPDDFARGTRMNLLAQESGAIVLYPAQAARSNTSKCWNWFQPGDQRRGAGEPALLAAMTQEIMRNHLIDEQRVHVTGLSAGGAMAAILGREYPELFASIGVHSGLAPGAAHDIPSAFAAMKNAPTSAKSTLPTPLIVFHGDSDKTVHPQNGEHVLGATGVRSKEQGVAGRGYTRTVIKDPDGRVRAEHWLVHGAGHAWSGGSAEGSYADALGPDASREMLRFFREHPRG